MSMFSTFLLGYLLGGLTLFPLLLYLYVHLPAKHISAAYERILVYLQHSRSSPVAAAQPTSYKSTLPLYKVGWLRMKTGTAPAITLMKPTEPLYFAVLKYHTLYLYDSDQQRDCQQVLSLQNYAVAMYPPDIRDAELFSRPYWVSLKPLATVDDQSLAITYFHCHLCTEKEDWYHLLLQACGQAKDTLAISSLQPLIQRIHSDTHNLELQWFNALLGRLFMGVHHTSRFREAIWTKIMTKVDKINARRPPFLGEIRVKAIEIGGNLPLLTQPRLLGLTPQGECCLEAMVDYRGAAVHVEIATVLQWTYSERMPPLTMDIVLRVTLQSLKGKLKLLVKPPPSNRIWYGFHGLPDMKWHIAPLVWEKKVGHSMVVKAIIKHLEEVIGDTMVLPHMDDFIFFDTNGIGGVYTDSGYKKKKVPDADDRQYDMELLTSAKALPELISSAHTLKSIPPISAYTAIPSDVPHPHQDSAASTPSSEHSISTTNVTDATWPPEPTLRSRRSMAQLGKKSAASPTVQVSSAAGLFLGHEKQKING
ncbi:putative integral membrane protein conserved region-domain-containing protein [Gongronella butleri]|nr:putative integral membrane protein conserved region-domain-containing protein [Gongronella butleri]